MVEEPGVSGVERMTIDAELFGDVLPTYLTRFVGRKAECAELTAMLDSSTARRALLRRTR
jgi:hypothetical protein